MPIELTMVTRILELGEGLRGLSPVSVRGQLMVGLSNMRVLRGILDDQAR